MHMYQFFKRVLDLLLAIAAFPFALILSVPVIIAVKAEDGGKIFYCGERLGYQMKMFRMYKFRSMKENAPDFRNRDGSTYNSEKDPRVTRIGSLLRRTSMDELPQILNVILGQMSWVGPRPSPLGNIERYDAEYRRKFSVRPGITGYNQVYYRNAISVDEKQKNDLYYVEHFSFWLDFKIIMQTIASVFRRKNLYTNNAVPDQEVHVLTYERKD
ncbi:MAG: sugar transferase [Oscillospiraceae bacterium]|nr:sugar transferase [Oscillospiraceae bacterium]